MNKDIPKTPGDPGNSGRSSKSNRSGNPVKPVKPGKSSKSDQIDELKCSRGKKDCVGSDILEVADNLLQLNRVQSNLLNHLRRMLEKSNIA